MLEAYILAMRDELAEIDEELIDLSKSSGLRELSRIERRAAERLLQLYIEACIGIAKHCIKKAKKNVPNDAYGAIEKLQELAIIEVGDIEGWRKIIGLRNVLVHDYLNIDKRIIKSVLDNQYYIRLREFAEKGLSYLEMDS